MSNGAETVHSEDDNELRDMVANLLEKNGTLAKIRAQLRASVFLALDEKEDALKNQPLMNQTMKKFLAGEDGRICVALVWEFLEYLGLDYTLSVFGRESYGLSDNETNGESSNAKDGFVYRGRSDIRTKLKLQSADSSSVPVLGELVRNWAKNGTTSTSSSAAGVPKETKPVSNGISPNPPATTLAPNPIVAPLVSPPTDPPRHPLGDLPPLMTGRGGALPPLTLGNSSESTKEAPKSTSTERVFDAVAESAAKAKLGGGTGGAGFQRTEVFGAPAQPSKATENGGEETDTSLAEEIDEDLSVDDLLNSAEEEVTSMHTISNSSGDDKNFYMETV